MSASVVQTSKIVSVSNEQSEATETKNHKLPTEQEQRCAHHLITILPQLRRIITRDLEGLEFPITMQQYGVLKALKEQPLLISELADMFKVSRPTMTRIIDGLEGRRKADSSEEEHFTTITDNTKRPKLVERIGRPGDRRMVYAKITEEGLNVLDCYYHKAEENTIAVLRKVSTAEITTLEQAFEILQMILNTTTS
jgi:DNA-binding MarR family transcriptional regulator